ncbi:OTU domain-containing protein 3 [Fistulifera solaris]|uniref:OTU domain-containing protein 3 n=1 Tax=Fistulifera solaris TaxID=1519565 RepID=A0A1Z5JDI8_FISSO|nr:OTU domain-containing protein 3 [Fistulifera solaris]|eukprot:GAX12057.1 OTU domain-containing protein 3 [Fistulifera solaris]
MGKKDKRKGSTTRDDGKGHNKELQRGRKFRQHKGRNWKADKNDPIRKAVEADGTRTIVDMSADGNCLFRALSDQIHGDYGNQHADVRTEVCDFMELHEDDFKVFLILDEDDEDAADFESYISALREDGEWGGNLELVAAARHYRRNIVVFSAEQAVFTIHHANKGSPSGPDLLLSYHDNDHYNSVRSNASTSAPHIPAPVHRNSDNFVKDKGKKKNVKRSDPCTCGSGITYKKCCFSKETTQARHQKQTRNKKDTSSDAGDSWEENFRVMAI